MIANFYIGNIATAGGTADVITASYVPVPTVLADKMLLYFRATAANATTTPTFSPNGLTAHTIVKQGGTALVAGDIPAVGAVMEVCYDEANTRWELINPATGNRKYKVYVALLNQTGTAAPVPTILENSIGAIVWTRVTDGYYRGTLASAFTVAKRWRMIDEIPNDDYVEQAYAVFESDSIIAIGTLNGGVNEDDILVDTPIEIRVYL